MFLCLSSEVQRPREGSREVMPLSSAGGAAASWGPSPPPPLPRPQAAALHEFRGVLCHHSKKHFMFVIGAHIDKYC